jgi:hypothetical protein
MEMYQDTERMHVIDMRSIRTDGQLRQALFGHEGGGDTEFMKKFDKYGGRLVVVLDEIANAPLEVLKGLYDLFREPEVTTFGDRQPRYMGHLIIVGTGNAGEEIYQGIPNDIPFYENWLSRTRVYQNFNNNLDMQRQILTRYFSEALLARIGMQNIFFFGPHSFKSARQLTMLKLDQAVRGLQADRALRGWNLQFASPESYWKIAEAIEIAAFNLQEQGASIDNFLKNIFTPSIKAALNDAGTPSDTDLLVELEDAPPQPHERDSRHSVPLRLTDRSTGRTISVHLKGRPMDRRLDREALSFVLTAYHEAGHALASQLFFGDKVMQTRISIIPGVDLFGDTWLYYAGVSEAVRTGYLEKTLGVVLREMAVLLAGAEAQRLVTDGEMDDAGKSNDIQRATRLAENAILRWGLTPFGQAAVGPHESADAYLAGLPETRREEFDRTLNALLAQAQDLARVALESNFANGLVPLGKLLAEKGEVQREELARFFTTADLTRTAIDRWQPQTLNGKSMWSLAYDWAKGWWASPPSSARDAKLKDRRLMPSQIADIEQIIANLRLEALRGLRPADDIPLAGGAREKESVLGPGIFPKPPAAMTGESCQKLF